ncbi:cytochrome c family protein [Pseudoduganella sp. LjRoot289]|uniref:c-type cytochrome n=1 Tax=Pseudoduganella sp. LjRoot289 TaxID=3342314 RepID=UPI003ED0B912
MRKYVLLVLVLVPPGLALSAPGDAAAGKRAFARCASCHQVGPAARGAFGPQLNGIVGRRAGATADYSYSPAMKQSGIVWTEQTLAAFLKSPKEVVPGNQMRFWGIGDEQQIANLVAYLRTAQ